LKITITMIVDDDIADPEDRMGVTEAGYDAILEALTPFGDNIDVARVDSE
jgi:hypothetical protein